MAPSTRRSTGSVVIKKQRAHESRSKQKQEINYDPICADASSTTNTGKGVNVQVQGNNGCGSSRYREEEEEDKLILDRSTSCCCTPKARRFRIPEVLTCPPAPKKRRVMQNCPSINNKKSDFKFFAHPDIELFFLFARSKVSPPSIEIND